ncbi:MAG TPA: selenocysteine-specific translation elongation factor [Oligoflexia bacterium]|nr:selenocysteine-specific translation elongation factor [Oligoflexia bacterium]HMP47478.1 selenocysteine-specific translation elongation factor [Oligoflexia bacterium]
MLTSNETSIKETHTTHPLAIIVGTAGHVDHGKTSLVRALTDFETDRHPEERARGMSIDFAVAPLTLSSGNTVGLIDVPGHEDFIKNMAAGASAIDILILVIAADDGVMPQTIEHLQIASHMGAKIVVPVITKTDLVDEETKNIVALEVLELLESFSIPHQDHFFVSNTSDEGIDELRNLLDNIINDFSITKLKEKKEDSGAFRMYIRASFLIEGHGLVVTGVPSSGTLKTGEEVELFSTAHKGLSKSVHQSRGQVRAIQNYRSKKEITQAHISSAINIRGIDQEHITRGVLLATPDVFSPSSEIMLRFINSSKSLSLKRGRRYQIHIGTYSGNVTVYPLGVIEVKPKEEAIIRARLQSPQVFLAGDRFIIRDINEKRTSTIGGGIIISRKAPHLKKKEREQYLTDSRQAILDFVKYGDGCKLELSASKQMFLGKQDILHITGGRSLEKSTFPPPVIGDDILTLSDKVFLNANEINSFKKYITGLTGRYHKNNPLQPGMLVSHLSSILKIENISDKAISNIFLNDPLIEVKKNILSLKSFKPVLEEKELKALESIKSMLAASDSFAKGTLVEAVGGNSKTLDKILKVLHASDEIRIIGNLVFSNNFLEKTRQKLSQKYNASGARFTLSEFRELSGLSRNFAVPVLEFFDGEGFTKKSPDQTRVVVR